MNPETEQIVDKLIESGFTDCSTYNQGRQVNASDKNGVIQTFYPTTGTILLRENNSKYHSRTKSLYSRTIEDFIQLLSNPTLIKMMKNEREGE